MSYYSDNKATHQNTQEITENVYGSEYAGKKLLKACPIAIENSSNNGRVTKENIKLTEGQKVPNIFYKFLKAVFISSNLLLLYLHRFVPPESKSFFYAGIFFVFLYITFKIFYYFRKIPLVDTYHVFFSHCMGVALIIFSLTLHPLFYHMLSSID